METYEISLLEDLAISSQIIGIIFAGIEIIAGIASKKQEEYHNKNRNHTLGRIAMSAILAYLIAGLVVLCKIPFGIMIGIIIIAYAIRYADKALYNVLIDKYLRNFSNAEIDSKIYSMKAFVNSIFKATIGVIGSLLLGITSTAQAMVIIGSIIMLLVLKYMSKRVGLKPEEYKREEIMYTK